MTSPDALNTDPVVSLDTPPDPSLDNLLQKAAKDGTVILIFSNNAYLPILENWRAAMDRLGIGNILYVALDEPTYHHLIDRGLVCYLLPCEDDLAALWRKRVTLFDEILQRGYNLIHSDADAVWLKDPRARYFFRSDADMVFSQGTQWPTECWQSWQFILCCGLFFLRATDAVQDFMRSWKEHVADCGDDQVSFNLLMLARSVTWEINKPYRIPTPFGVDITCSRQTIYGQADKLCVEVLPQHLFQRVHFPTEDAYVKHCLSGQTAQTTRQGLEETGCWVLPPEASVP